MESTMESAPWLHKVQYYETDQMAVVHHSNYIRWFEEARIDWFARHGLPVSEIERRNIRIPVVGCSAKFKISARLEEIVEISVKKKSYNGVVLVLEYEVRSHETGKLMATGETSHGFTDPNGLVLNLKHRHPEEHALLEEM